MNKYDLSGLRQTPKSKCAEQSVTKIEHTSMVRKECAKAFGADSLEFLIYQQLELAMNATNESYDKKSLGITLKPLQTEVPWNYYKNNEVVKKSNCGRTKYENCLKRLEERGFIRIDKVCTKFHTSIKVATLIKLKMTDYKNVTSVSKAKCEITEKERKSNAMKEYVYSAREYWDLLAYCDENYHKSNVKELLDKMNERLVVAEQDNIRMGETIQLMDNKITELEFQLSGYAVY